MFFEKISQQGNTCVGVSFSKSCGADGLQLYEKETPTQVFSCEYCEIFENSFFCRIPPVAAFVSLIRNCSVLLLVETIPTCSC